MKKLIALMTVSAMLATSAAVLADEINTDEILDGTINEVQGDIMLISNPDLTPIDEVPTLIPSSYISKDVTVTEINDNMISTTLNGMLMVGNVDAAQEGTELENGLIFAPMQENVVNYTVNEETLVYSYATGEKKAVSDVKVGDNLTVYTNAYAPALMIFPPQYQADVIMIRDDEIDSLVLSDVDTYLKNDDMLVNVANTLALNIDETTVVVDKEGKAVSADDLNRKDLIVFFSDTTRSIPAQTTPVKVVVLGENEIALANIDAATTIVTDVDEPGLEPDERVDFFGLVTEVKVGDKVITNVYAKGDTVMVPLREITETLGLTVDWDGELKAVMIGGGIYSLQIGKNSYVKGRMAPVELKFAPEITNDLTYVPTEYFTEILEAQVTADTANIISIDLAVTPEVTE
ncbi:MAG: copper amine oxidase N-terminal domain-containing protein [Oscillospiraceae bacterium]|nr:copper amine oxidase N-terminal domain-containing protein [Oscillospiraceae bacterium]